MKILCYYDEDSVKLGLKKNERVLELSISPDAFYRQGLDALSGLPAQVDSGSPIIDESDLKLAPVVPNPGKIICVGLNYRKHAEESGMDAPEYPVLFSKFNNTLAGAGQPVAISPEWKQVDYEAEMAVVIGRQCRHVPVSEAPSAALGYACANDLSERERQFRTSQWLLGKSLDGFMPIGPYLVTADEIDDPQNLSIRGWLNGDLRQDSSTADMIFSVAEIIAYTSRQMTLEPGDVILTGTPEGVALGRPESGYMQPGDSYVIEIEKLGRLETHLVEAAA